MILIILYLVTCALVASMSKNRAISGGALFLLSLILTPGIGFIIALLYPSSPDLSHDNPSEIRYNKECPRCKEEIHYLASICKHCSLEIKVDSVSPMTYDPEEIISKYATIKTCSSCRGMNCIDNRWTHWYCQKCAEINLNN